MPSQVAEAEKTGAEPSASLSDEDLEAEQWAINTNTPSPTPLGEAAPLLTQPMAGGGVGDGEDALNALGVAACQASAAAWPSKFVWEVHPWDSITDVSLPFPQHGHLNDVPRLFNGLH